MKQPSPLRQPTESPQEKLAGGNQTLLLYAVNREENVVQTSIASAAHQAPHIIIRKS